MTLKELEEQLEKLDVTKVRLTSRRGRWTATAETEDEISGEGSSVEQAMEDLIANLEDPEDDEDEDEDEDDEDESEDEE